MSEYRALIVEDSRTASAFLAKALKKYDIESDFLNNSLAAFNYLRKSKPPSVIFMDQTLPGITGIEAIKQLKASSFTRTIPVIMYTGSNDENLLEEAKAVGAEGILSKKLEPKQVESLLQQLELLPSQRLAAELVFTDRQSENELRINERPPIPTTPIATPPDTTSPVIAPATAPAVTTRSFRFSQERDAELLELEPMEMEAPLLQPESALEIEPAAEEIVEAKTRRRILAPEVVGRIPTVTPAMANRERSAEHSLTDLDRLLEDKLTALSNNVLKPFLSEIQRTGPNQPADSGEHYQSMDQLIDTKFNEFCQHALQPYLSRTLSSELEKLEQRERARQAHFVSEIKKHIDSLQAKTQEPLEHFPDEIDTSLMEPPISKIKYKPTGVMVGVLVFAVALVGFYQWF